MQLSKNLLWKVNLFSHFEMRHNIQVPIEIGQTRVSQVIVNRTGKTDTSLLEMSSEVENHRVQLRPQLWTATRVNYAPLSYALDKLASRVLCGCVWHAYIVRRSWFLLNSPTSLLDILDTLPPTGGQTLLDRRFHRLALGRRAAGLRRIWRVDLGTRGGGESTEGGRTLRQGGGGGGRWVVTSVQATAECIHHPNLEKR